MYITWFSCSKCNSDRVTASSENPSEETVSTSFIRFLLGPKKKLCLDGIFELTTNISVEFYNKFEGTQGIHFLMEESECGVMKCWNNSFCFNMLDCSQKWCT